MKPLIRELPIDKIQPFNTGVLIIDMQKDFVNLGQLQPTPGALAIVPMINKLIHWARQHTVPIIFTQEMHRADHSDFGIELEYDTLHCIEETTGVELTEDLAIQPQDYRVINKRRYDGFMGTDLDLLLRSKRIENLICCGVTAHVCVMNTVYTARNLDYRVIVLQDAIAGVTPDHYAAALFCMSDLFAYISTTDQVTQLWSYSAALAREKRQEEG